MPNTKPTKPSITLPSAFGTSVSNVKTPFTPQELIDGYSASIQQVLDGGNVNWLNDTTFKFLTYTTAICDWLNSLGTGYIPYINSSNQLDGLDLNTMISKWGLFDYKWSDHEITDQSWLKADTFSWQPGTTYTNAYNALVIESTGVTATTETVGSYTITVYVASNGHKIVMADQETTVQNIYNESGVAWYYILDTTNQRFKLPRTKFGFTGYRDTVGKYVPETLPAPTHTHTYQEWGRTGGTQIGYDTNNHKVFYDEQRTTSVASGFPSTYQANAPVQQRSTQMYLYFYVGQFTQSATEQTAGLNASLFNGKVDLDAGNLSNAGKSFISGLGLPSNTYEDWTPGASGTKYQPTADGWLCIGFQHPNNSNYENYGVDILDSNDNFIWNIQGTRNLNNQTDGVVVAIRKEQKVQIWSNGYTINRLRFIYAKGSESEAS